MRMIDPAMWTQCLPDGFSKSDIDADSISDLRTTNNCISTWYVEDKDNVEDIKKAVVALASGFKSLDDMSVVLLDYDDVSNAGFEIEKNPGNTKIEQYKNLHRDVSKLKAESLISLSSLIYSQIIHAEKKRYAVDQIITWMFQTMDSGGINFSIADLQKNAKETFVSRINKRIKALDRKKKRETLTEEEMRLDAFYVKNKAYLSAE